MKRLKLVFSFVTLVLLSACGGTSQNSNPMTAILAAEQRGDIPTLNHDTSLSGPDLDRNGVRDDIDAYINSLSDTPEQKQALLQNAKALQSSLLVDKSDKSAVREVGKKISKSVGCLSERYDDLKTLLKNGKELEKITANTPERYKAYAKYNGAVSGMGFDAIDKGDRCDN